MVILFNHRITLFLTIFATNCNRCLLSIFDSNQKKLNDRLLLFVLLLCKLFFTNNVKSFYHASAVDTHLFKLCEVLHSLTYTNCQRLSVSIYPLIRRPCLAILTNIRYYITLGKP